MKKMFYFKYNECDLKKDLNEITTTVKKYLRDYNKANKTDYILFGNVEFVKHKPYYAKFYILINDKTTKTRLQRLAKYNGWKLSI